MEHLLTDIVCFSHLRWDFVYQRPQHLLSRFANHSRVFFIEEPVFYDGIDKIEVSTPQKNLWVVTPFLQSSSSGCSRERQKKLITALFYQESIKNYLFWYYTPLALAISDIFSPRLIIYDCMDELSAFKFAPVELKQKEKELFSKADLVFTGGASIFEAKKKTHEAVYCFPSSIDKAHFSQARQRCEEPADQAAIPHPRIGFYGVVDERFDIELLRKVAEQRPRWHFVIIGPVVKIDPAHLPQGANIHYLGSKKYDELPRYLAGWDIAACLFARNESTRYISPTKTPEYLAGGKPVVSTAIKDVVDTYGKNDLVHIAETPEDFIECVEKELATTDKKIWLQRVDTFLQHDSWDATWASMAALVRHRLKTKKETALQKIESNTAILPVTGFPAAIA
ncbi:glycosyltransferase family 1 protein [Runella sp.]|uniref:glycosyltransferase family 1 protein n=1 Tax=Runella sp. TaxID=1960881 RepID=UPI003D0FD325